MKKQITCLLMVAAVLCFIGFSNTAEAASASAPERQTTQVEFLENGSSIETTVQQFSVNANTRSLMLRSPRQATGSKTLTYRNASGNIVWTFKVTATFINNNGVITCQSLITQQNIYNSSWSLSNINKGSSGNYAWASVTGTERYAGRIIQQITRNVSLTCDSNGIIS